MAAENTDAQPATQAVEALLKLDQYGRALCPAEVDPDAWSADALYELARIAELLGTAVEQVSGERNEAAERNAYSLSTVIAAHRNNMMRQRPT